MKIFAALLLLSTSAFAHDLYTCEPNLQMTMAARPFPKPTDKQWVVKGLTAKKQEKKLWCGAASAQVLLSQWQNPVPKQCALAGWYHKSDCCSWNGSGRCNAEVLVEKTISDTRMKMAPTFDDVFSLIQRGRPVAIYHYNGSNLAGHSSVAYWAYISGGKKYVLTYDPYYDRKVVMDESWVNNDATRWYRIVYVK